jgi:hypothetical protein
MQYIDAAQKRREREQIVRRIAETTVANGGGTYQHRTGAPVALRDGYVVAVANINEYPVAADSDEVTVVSRFIDRAWPDTLPPGGQYVGTWYQSYGDHGATLYVDVVAVYRDKEQALAAARRNDEQCIYDIANATDIIVDRWTA